MRMMASVSTFFCGNGAATDFRVSNLFKMNFQA
jgi:hypothetical protein